MRAGVGGVVSEDLGAGFCMCFSWLNMIGSLVL